MFFSILKKDLKRRKTANIILLVFIMLASMFISSSMNNVLAVMNGIDYFWEKANMPDLIAVGIQTSDEKATIAQLKSIDSYDVIPVRVLDVDQLTHEGETVEHFSPYMIPYMEQTLLFFDENNNPIREVAPGTVRVSASSMREAGLKTGDSLRIELEGKYLELVIAGPLKDPTCLGKRYVMNADDYDAWFAETDVLSGEIFYIYTSNRAETMEQISSDSASGLILYEKETLRLNLFPDMILAGILLAVSICLMLIAFVVLRFTLSFTLQEEYRQIGVMKAIGLTNTGIRGLYLAKYLLLSVVGATIGFFGSIPFSGLLLDSISQAMVLGNENSMLVNGFCSIFVVVVTLAFCYGCTGKVKKYTPVDAIRSGTTGERFRKKGLLQLSRTPGRPVVYLALNDVLSQPRRFGTIVLTLFLCLSLVLMLTTSINTLKSDGLIPALNMTHFDVICSGGYTTSPSSEGSRMLRESMEKSEGLLRSNGLDCRSYTEVDFALSLNYGEKKCDAYVAQGVGTTMDQYVYFEGSAPCHTGEIAITKQVAEKLGAGIGDTVTMQIGTETREFLVTGHYQTMMNQGLSARVHQDEVISYEYLISSWGMQVEFLDDPSEKEIQNRIPLIKEILNVNTVQTEAEYVEFMTGMAEILEYVRLLFLAISLIITVLITVLIGHSFIAKERGDIAILKAIGFRNGQLMSWQALRFVIICVIATIFAIVLHIPLMELAITPIFTAMGAYFGVQFEIAPLEIYCIYPAIFLAVTAVSAFLTARHVCTVQTNECSNID